MELNRDLFFRRLLAEDLIVKSRQCPKLVGPQGIYRFLGELALAGCYSDSAPPSRFSATKPAEEQRRIALLAGVKGAGVTHYDEAEAILAMANRLGMPAGSVEFNPGLVAELMMLRFNEEERRELRQFAELIGRPLNVEDKLLRKMRESSSASAVEILENYRRLPEAYRFYFFRNGYIAEVGQELDGALPEGTVFHVGEQGVEGPDSVPFEEVDDVVAVLPQGSIFLEAGKLDAIRQWASTHPATLSNAAAQIAQEIAEIDLEILRLQKRRRELLGG